MNKKKYYVSISSGEISQVKVGNNDEYIIYATDDEVKMLRAKLTNMYDADFDSFWRAHVPIMPYHNDKGNQRYDEGLTEVFQMIYDLGDEQAKSHIEEIGVLSDRSL